MTCSHHEKLRPSVEAVQKYNAGQDDSEQFSITGLLLCRLTGVLPLSRFRRCVRRPSLVARCLMALGFLLMMYDVFYCYVGRNCLIVSCIPSA